MKRRRSRISSAVGAAGASSWTRRSAEAPSEPGMEAANEPDIEPMPADIGVPAATTGIAEPGIGAWAATRPS